MSSSVPSPCTGVCRIDPSSGWCEGCRRTIDEIVSWSSLGDPAKLRVWKLLRARRAAPEAGSPDPARAGIEPIEGD